MNKIIGIIILSAMVAWSSPWYTTVAIDSSGQVCAGGIGWGLNLSDGSWLPMFEDGFLNCQNGHYEKFDGGFTDLVVVGGDSLLMTSIDFNFNENYQPSYDTTLEVISSATILNAWSQIGSTSYVALRGIMPISADSILLAHEGGLTVSNFAMSHGRAMAGIPAELSSGPVRSIATDFQGRLWAGTDLGVWVQDREGDTTWTYHAVGWPVRNIFPKDTNFVVITSFNMSLDGYNQSAVQRACIQSDTLDTTCTSLPYFNYCPRPGNCYEVQGPAGGLQYSDHGVKVKSLGLYYVWDLALAPNGTLWAATGDGLFSIDTSTFVATRQYLGLDTPTVVLPRVHQDAEWSFAQQGRHITLQSTVAGKVDLIAPNGIQAMHVSLNKGVANMDVPHAGVWLLRFTPVKGAQKVRRMVVME